MKPAPETVPFQKALAMDWLNRMPAGSIYYLAEVNAGGALAPDQPVVTGLVEQLREKVFAEVAKNEATRGKIIVGLVILPANDEEGGT